MPSGINKILKTTAALCLLKLLISIPSFAQGGLSLKTVVIDAGHGGHDPGAVSPDRKTQEKTINLDVALMLGKKIEQAYPDVKVIYTRTKDVYLTLNARTDVANKNDADLFISIHVNSAKSTSANGTETFVMGTDKSSANMEVSKRENSVILLEDDYSTKYQGYDPNDPQSLIFFNLMQNAYFEQSIAMASCVQKQFAKGPITRSRGIKQEPLLVLWRTTMPSVLIEIGFLSNASDRKVLTSKDKREEIAEDIFQAFRSFKQQYDAHTGFDISDVTVGEEQEEPDEEPQPEELAKPEMSSYYTVQILAVNRKLSSGAADFKGISNYDCRLVGGLYKYSVGKFRTKQEAGQELSRLKAKFPGAFITFVEVDK